MNPAAQHAFRLATLSKLGYHALSALTLLLCVQLVFAQSPAPTNAESTAGTKQTKPLDEKPKVPEPAPGGSIKGRVKADDGRVLANVLVLARAINGTPGMKAAQVDAEGRFTLDDMPAALYLVFATAPGYVDEQLVAGELDQLPRYLIGSQVNLRLVKGGVITGTVTDSKGHPVVGVPVRSVPGNAASTLMSVSGGTGIGETDDRGVYRTFGLPPGQYTVCAGGGGQFARFTTSGFELDSPTYYPSSTFDTAVPVSVRAGDESLGIDIRYKGLQGHSVSGAVAGKVDPNSANNAISVLLLHANTTNMIGISVTGIAEQGRSFDFDGVADGDYDLFAIFATDINDSVAAASRRVAVRGGDITGVELVLTTLGSISGSFKLDPIAPELKCDKRRSELSEVLIEVPRDDPRKSSNKMLTLMMGGFSGSFSAKGDFSLKNLEAGTYRPLIKLPTEAWYVRAISLPARLAQPSPANAERTADSTAGPNRILKPAAGNGFQGTVTIKSGEKLAGVSIQVGQDAAGLRGRVVTPEGSVMSPGLRVYLLPTEREEAGNILRYFETGVDSNGNFTFTNVAPGRYFIFPRVEAAPPTETAPRPLAFDSAARIVLRRSAEALNNAVELKPCQRMTDVALKSPGGPTQ